jgi:DNA polymerase I-like protein with 3'-5' exonuclease and polymerase domains
MTQSGFPLSELEARNIYNRFKQTYKVAMDYSKQVVQHMEQGNSIANLMGRPIRIEKPEECYLKAFNSLIQSSASDMLLFSCNKAVTDLKSNGIDGKVILLVHDYVGISVPDADVELATKLIEAALTGFDLSNSLGKIPITVDGGVSKVWEK